MIILSADPVLVLAVLSGLVDALPVRMEQGVEQILHPQYRVAVHTLGFPDTAELRNLCDEILAEFGFDCYTFPAWAIQGLVTVEHQLALAWALQNDGN